MGWRSRGAVAVLLLCGMRAMPQLPPPAVPFAPAATTYFSPTVRELPHISQEVVVSKPFSVLGPRGCILGQQDGSFEAWTFPWKIFSGMNITAEMQDYAVPIAVNEHAAEIDVQPQATTITYAHANFTLRQIMFAPKEGPASTGALVYFEVEAVRPVTLTFSFHPVMQRMWPAESPDVSSPEWVANGQGSGFYILHLNGPAPAAALAMPGAHAGILAPYQERARSLPLQFVLHVDPKEDGQRLFPLLITLASTPEESSKAAFARTLLQLNAAAPRMFAATADYYRNLLQQHTALETPDAHLNEAFSWAVAAIDQLKVETTPIPNEEAFTAGFVGSGDAARPGFGWFFGRDALWTIYAVNSYGDFKGVRAEIEFLLKRQSPEGKVMHEWAQTADLVDWRALPYAYASSDATTLLPMVMSDYLQISGDRDFIAAHWEQLLRAWQFETGHTSPDGIYNNAQGSGWVESWIPSMPHQEIYLAVLDQQASTAFARLARVTGHNALAEQATARAKSIGQVVDREYYLPERRFYAFSHNDDGSTDETATVFPAVAWWDGSYSLPQATPMFQRWAGAEFSTDWGTRLLSDRTSFYDPISYHQGTVWPLFTGWVSVAEYRAGHPLAGYQHLMQNVDLTWAQDPGAVTELLSGQFYQVLGRSTAHQLWSSAMVISPTLRGLFGLSWDASAHTLSVTPHLPAAWDRATVRRIPFGAGTVDLEMQRDGLFLLVTAHGSGPGGVQLGSESPDARVQQGVLRIPLPPVEAGVSHALPAFGSETQQLKVLDEQISPHQLTLLVSAPQGTTQKLVLRVNDPSAHVAASDGVLGAVEKGTATFTVAFPVEGAAPSPTATYVEKTVMLRW